MKYRIMRSIGRHSIGLFIFAGFVSLAMLLVATGPSAAPGERNERAWPISTMEARPDAMSPVLLAYGSLESRQRADVRSRLTAHVEKVLYFEGDWVEKGDVLLRLDPLDAELALEAAEATRDQAASALESAQSDHALARELLEHHQSLQSIAQSRLERFRELHKQRMISDSELDDMRQQASERRLVLATHLAEVRDFPNRIARQRAVLQEAESRYRQAQRDSEHTVLRAPVSGRVLTADVSIGDRVSAGTSLMQIADYEQLQLRVSIPSSQAMALRFAMQNGSRITAVAEIGQRDIDFDLLRLSGDVKPGQSGVDAFFATSGDPELLIGSLARMRINMPEQDAVVPVPVHALYQNNEVYRVRGSRLEAVEVERVGEYLDAAGDYRLLVRSAELQPGDSLMITQLPVAMTGLLVAPVDQDMPAMIAGK